MLFLCPWIWHNLSLFVIAAAWLPFSSWLKKKTFVQFAPCPIWSWLSEFPQTFHVISKRVGQWNMDMSQLNLLFVVTKMFPFVLLNQSKLPLSIFWYRLLSQLIVFCQTSLLYGLIICLSSLMCVLVVSILVVASSRIVVRLCLIRFVWLWFQLMTENAVCINTFTSKLCNNRTPRSHDINHFNQTHTASLTRDDVFCTVYRGQIFGG